MDDNAIREILVLGINGEPKTYAEIHFLLKKARAEINSERRFYLELFLALLYHQKGAPALALKYVESVLTELAAAPLKIGVLKDDRPSGQDIRVLAEQLKLSISNQFSGGERARVADKIALQQSPLKLSKLEEKLIECLKKGPQNKFDLIVWIYGSRINPLAAENRIKNLIHRIRIKFPNLIRLRNNHYELN